jgi:glycosyltransferase involved in cell wall biosynthesis
MNPRVEERLLASSGAATDATPFLTIGIPHYKHRRFLEAVLDSLFAQSYRDFEILVSDDCSPGDSKAVIPALLEKSERPFRYYAQPTNLGYDGNVRFCLRAARGRYVFLLGNDDALADPDTLDKVAAKLGELDLPEVVFTNYEDWESGEVVRRALSTCALGAGPAVAVTHFRSFSFVSGLIYDRAAAVRHETDRWDRSIYYQIYIACRILAAGGRLGAMDLCAVRKDVRVEGHTVPSYASKWANAPWSFQSRHAGLDSVIRVTADAVLPLLPERQQSAALRRIVAKVLLTTYPFWLFEYRRVSNWSFAAGIAREMRPWKLLKEHQSRHFDSAYLYALYALVTVTGLVFPLALFKPASSRLAELVRYLQQSSAATA